MLGCVYMCMHVRFVCMCIVCVCAYMSTYCMYMLLVCILYVRSMCVAYVCVLRALQCSVASSPIDCGCHEDKVRSH